MATNKEPIFINTPKNGAVQIVNADSTNKKTLFTAGSDGARIDEIFLDSDDTSAVNVKFWITTGGIDYYIGYVNVPIGSGYPSVVKVAAMQVLSPILGYIQLEASAILKCGAAAAVTAAKTVDVVIAAGGNY